MVFYFVILAERRIQQDVRRLEKGALTELDSSLRH
jgi:hypothetical protein